MDLKMLGKLVFIWLAWYVNSVRGFDTEFYNVMHNNQYGDHMDLRVWNHANNFTQHFMDHFYGEHEEHMDTHRENLQKEKVECDKCACKKCIMKGAKYISIMVEKKIEKWCDMSEEDHEKMHLESMKEHNYEHENMKDAYKEMSEKEKEEHDKEHKMGHHDWHKMKKFFCMAHKKQPAMTLGYVLFHMRPAQSSMAWCAGAGYCKKHHKPQHLIFHKDVTEDELTHEETSHAFIEPQFHPEWEKMSSHLLSNAMGHHEEDHHDMMDHHHHMHHHGHHHHGHHHHGDHHHHRDKDDDEDVNEQSMQQQQATSDESMMNVVARKLKEIVVGEEDDEDINLTAKNIQGEWGNMMEGWTESHEMKCMDKKCFIKVMKFVMGMAVKRTIGFCKKTQCPPMQKLCMFMGKHPKFAYGALLAMVQPEKFAMGRCFKRDSMFSHKHGLLGHFMQKVSTPFKNVVHEIKEESENYHIADRVHSMMDHLTHLFTNMHMISNHDDHTEEEEVVVSGPHVVHIQHNFRGN